MKISVVGLGTAKDEVTLRGLDEIMSADVVALKTAMTDTADTLRERNIDFVSCDSLFDEARDFSVLNQKIFEFLRAAKGKVVFCVNGSGYDDSAVAYIAERADVSIFGSVSNGAAALEKRPAGAYQYFCAADLAGTNVLTTNLPLVVTEIDDRFLASAVKEKLCAFYDDEEEVLFCGKKTERIPLYEIDRQKHYDQKTSLLIAPKKLTEKKSFEVSDLKEILRVLRGENGCPWDKAQTHESLRANVLEEAYELVDAIDGGNIEDIVEETGDNLLQSYFHISLAEENGEFDEKEVLTRLCGKLIFRHTHIFGQDKAANSEEALKVWEKNKAVEKGTRTVTDTMRKVAKSLPSLTRAAKVQKRAAKNKFDWTDTEGLFDKLREEAAELDAAYKERDAVGTEKEAGDLLFQAVNICRYMGVDPEVALNRAVEKFTKRFEYMENRVLETHGEFADASRGEMEKFWDEAKSKGL